MIDPVGTAGVPDGLWLFALGLLAVGLTLMTIRRRP
jgi:hypothetical protein